jgi:hypothetical protein
MSATDITGGLAVVSLHGAGRCWYVTHAASGLPLFSGGYLRQKRFAVQAREDFLATGTDFTRDAREVGRDLRGVPVSALWRRRVQQDCIDPVTGEHYSWSTHYGQVIPSAAHAARIAEAMASYAWS